MQIHIHVYVYIYIHSHTFILTDRQADIQKYIII